ncbi:hypothetical protein L7F22_026404 [Adiantum nelumboides]|nr:hypothetical protein [Adiantum nelumboides]
MKTLKVSLLILSRKEACSNVGFRLFSAGAVAESICDILEREYCVSPLEAPSIEAYIERKAPAIPDNRKAFVEETIHAINTIVIETTAKSKAGALEPMKPHIQKPEDEDPNMRSSYGVYRLLLEICNIRSWMDRDTEMKKFLLVLRPTQVAWVLKVQKESTKAWDFFNWAARRPGYAHDQHCYAVMIDLLGKSSEYLFLESLLAEMDRQCVPHNAITLNRLIDIFTVKGDAEKAELYFDKLIALERQPNSYIIKCMMEVFATAGKCQKALELFQVMLERRHFIGIKSYNNLLESLSRNGMVNKILRIYGGMKEHGTVADMTTYGILLGALGHAGMLDKAMELWAEMVQQGLKPSREAYNGILAALAGQSNADTGICFFKRMAEEGVDPDFLSCQAVSKLLCKAGQARRTLELAQLFETKSVKMKVYESFIKELGNAGYTDEVCLLVEGLKADNIVPHEAIFLGMINVLCSKGAEPNKVMAALEDMEKSCGNLSAESYNSILSSLCQNNQFHFAFDVLKLCHGSSKSADAEISNAIFVGLSKKCNLHLVEGIFDELNMVGSALKVTTFNALLDSSAQMGDVETTKRVLQIMEAKSVSPDVSTYNAAIRCFGRAGRFNIALQVFNEMRVTGCVPNTSSYNNVLAILRKAGLKNAVSSFFERMKVDGVMPDASTFSLVSDIHENCTTSSRAHHTREVHSAALA